MELKQYSTDALRTESRIEKVQGISPPTLYSAMTGVAATANILDSIKKHIFYGKAVDHSELLNGIELAIDCLRDLKHDFENQQVHDVNKTEMFQTPAGYFTEIGPAQLESLDPRILHVALGVATESGEIVETLLRQMEGEQLDMVNLSEEIGDLNWYANGIFPDASGISYSKYLSTNIVKLAVRYPEKFSSWLAKDENRHLVEERKALEAGIR